MTADARDGKLAVAMRISPAVTSGGCRYRPTFFFPLHQHTKVCCSGGKALRAMVTLTGTYAVDGVLEIVSGDTSHLAQNVFF